MLRRVQVISTEIEYATISQNQLTCLHYETFYWHSTDYETNMLIKCIVKTNGIQIGFGKNFTDHVRLLLALTFFSKQTNKQKNKLGRTELGRTAIQTLRYRT